MTFEDFAKRTLFRDALPARQAARRARFSVATGRPVRSLWPVYFGGADAPGRISGEVVMWSNAPASVIVLQANLISGNRSNGQTATGVLTGNQFTPIPAAPSTNLLYYGLVF